MNRRKALMAGLGSIFAGPGAMKDALKGYNSPLSKFGQPRGGEIAGYALGQGQDIPRTADPVESAIKHREYMKSRLEKMKNMLAGKYDEWQSEQLVDFRTLKQEKISYDVDSLKSLSNSGKLMILDSRNKKNQEETWAEQAKKEIDGLEKALSQPISNFLFGASTQGDKQG